MLMKIASVSVALAMALALSGCGDKPSGPNDQGPPRMASAALAARTNGGVMRIPLTDPGQSATTIPLGKPAEAVPASE